LAAALFNFGNVAHFILKARSHLSVAELSAVKITIKLHACTINLKGSFTLERSGVKLHFHFVLMYAQ